MSDYKNILVAIDFESDYEHIIGKALNIAQSVKDLSLVHITLPSIYIQPYLYGMQEGILDDSDITGNARKKLETIADKFGINKDNIHVKFGDVANEIRQIATEIDADLIVIGTHGRSGFKLLLGSTTNALLHGVQHDVLAIRIKE